MHNQVRKVAIGLAFYITAVGIAACGKRLSPKDYVEYVDQHKNKYCVEIERNGILARVCYRSSDYLLARHLYASDSADLERARNLTKDNIMFLVGLGILSEGNALGKSIDIHAGDEAAGLARRMFQCRDHIYLISTDALDTVRSRRCHYERDWGVGAGAAYSVIFSIKDMKHDLRCWRLIMRDLTPMLGTLDVPLGSFGARSFPKLAGYIRLSQS